MGGASTQKNFMVARYAEALLLYAEACIGADEANGLKALNEVQVRPVPVRSVLRSPSRM